MNSVPHTTAITISDNDDVYTTTGYVTIVGVSFRTRLQFMH